MAIRDGSNRIPTLAGGLQFQPLATPILCVAYVLVHHEIHGLCWCTRTYTSHGTRATTPGRPYEVTFPPPKRRGRQDWIGLRGKDKE